MRSLNLDDVRAFVDNQYADIYQRRTELLKTLRLEGLLPRDPYLFCFQTKGSFIAGALIRRLIDERLASYDVGLFDAFLLNLAVFVSQKTCEGHKSTAPGVDLEFFNRGIHYVVSVKSGPNWGNSSQQRKLEEDLKNAVARVKQSRRGANVQAVLGICYGKTRTGYLRGYLKVVGQNFWYLISDNRNLYIDIVEPVGYRAREHNEAFMQELGKVANRLTGQLIQRFCNDTGAINWAKLVEFNSGNYDLEQFLP